MKPHWFHRWVVLGIISPLFRWLTLTRREGMHRLPKGGYVIGFNHPGLIDPLVVGASHPGPLYMLGKKEEFDRPVTGWILRRVMRCIPLDRKGGDNQWALDEAVARLQDGEPFAMAPEGTSNKRGPLGRGRSGAARLALAAGVPMVPVAFIRTRRAPWRIVFGEPMDTTAWHGKQDDHAAVREATDRFMERLAALLGESYDAASAPDYAGRRGFRRSA